MPAAVNSRALTRRHLASGGTGVLLHGIGMGVSQVQGEVVGLCPVFSGLQDLGAGAHLLGRGEDALDCRIAIANDNGIPNFDLMKAAARLRNPFPPVPTVHAGTWAFPLRCS